MTPAALKTLTWATIAAAVVSAALLAALDSGFPEAGGGGQALTQMALPSNGSGAGARHESLPPAQRQPGAAQAAAER